jgi:hypothetical protein
MIAILPHVPPNFRPAFGSSALIDVNDETYCGYYDYYAAKMFIEQESKCVDRIIVFVGELGVSSGSRGMYRYLLDHPKLKLCVRKVIHQQASPQHADYLITHEVFLFKILS